jgi:micrococcal nuclease
LARDLLFTSSVQKKIDNYKAESSMRYFMNRKFSIFVIPILILFFLLSTSHAEIYKVKRVIDGDTLLLINGERVRLIGVNTPETKHPQKPVEYFGKEAHLFTKQMVDGKEARFEFEKQKRDRYGRLLAYVYLLNGTFLNAEIIKQGYGKAYTRFRFKYMEEFRRYEREARQNRRGLWR